MLQPSPAPRRQGHLFRALCDAGGLDQAWREVRGRWSAGALPPEAAEFERRHAERIAGLAARLQSRSFLPSPAALVLIPKPGRDDERRRIAVSPVEDRIVLTRLHRLLYPLVDRRLSERCYAYRQGRGPLDAIRHADACVRRGLRHSSSGDIDDFFDSIDRPLLFQRIRATVWEPPVLDLLETYLHIGAHASAAWADTGRGIAQGSPLSPLLSNLYLAPFDAVLDELGVEWVRYSDNLLLLARERETAAAALGRAADVLEAEHGLRFNAGSVVHAAEAEGFEFLGFRFRMGKRTIDPKRMERKLAELDARYAGDEGSPKRRLLDAAETLRGWRGYYAWGDTRAQVDQLEKVLEDALAGWLARYRAGRGRTAKTRELRAWLGEAADAAGMSRKEASLWAARMLQRSRPPREAPPEGPESTAARRAVAARRRQLERRRAEAEDLLISRPGTFVGRRGERIVVRQEGRSPVETPMNLVKRVTLLTKAASVSADLLASAASRGLEILILGPDGRPAARAGSVQGPRHETTVAQAALAASPEGLDLARQFVLGKVGNQARLLRYLSKYRGRLGGGAPDLIEAAAEIEEIAAAVEALTWSEAAAGEIELGRGRLFAAEGRAAERYWRALGPLFPPAAGFPGRVRRGAADLANSLLNYGYGILYGRLGGVLSRVGLNLAIGFLHKPRDGKEALLYDFIEEFRPAAVDRVVLRQLGLRKPYAVDAEGLTVETRRDLARAVSERLRAETPYRGERLPLRDVIEEQARRLARHIVGRERYRPWRMPW